MSFTLQSLSRTPANISDKRKPSAAGEVAAEGCGKPRKMGKQDVCLRQVKAGNRIVQQTKTKKQHYVPQSYLRRFSPDGTHVFVFDKVLRRSFSQAIKSVAQENCFYDVPQNDGSQWDEQEAEKMLAEVDGITNEAIATLLDTFEEQEIPRDLRYTIAYSIVMQSARTPTARDTMRGIMHGLRDHMVQDAESQEWDGLADIYRSAFTMGKKNEAYHHVLGMTDLDSILPAVTALLNCVWTVGVNVSSAPLITSDNPVNTSSDGFELFYPVTPKHLLMLGQRRHFDHIKHLDGKSIDLDEQNVAHYNAYQVMQSRRQVFSTFHDFRLAELICTDRPEVCGLPY